MEKVMIINETLMYGISDAVKQLRPNAIFELTNTKFTQWFDKTGLQPPSWDEVMEQFEKNRIEFERQQYARDRSKEYASTGEQLDQIWHAINSGVDLKESEWFKNIQATKEKYPKSE
jgi:hypothetical protein